MMLLAELALAYLLGALPFGVLVGRWRGVDVTRTGSGNIGATNVWRTLGPAAGTLVFVLDFFKGVAGPMLARLASGPHDHVAIAGCGLAVGVGHICSIFLKGRGGKGAATGLGVLTALAPGIALLGMVGWVIVLVLGRMISLASCATAVIIGVLAVMPRLLPHLPLPHSMVPAFEWPEMLITWILVTVTLVKHRANFARILAGTEPRIRLWHRAASHASASHFPDEPE